MKILITNDDGIDSKLIPLLKEEVELLNKDVTICCPDKNNSAISQAIRFWEYDKNTITKVSDNIYKHPGTPADGIYYYLRDYVAPDLVISGVNIGLNASIDVQYSGTIGAASEAINNKINAIAISADKDASLDTISKCLKIILDLVINNNYYSNEVIYSFNIPYEIKNNSIKIAKLSGKEMEKDSDLYFLSKGYITLTPILVNRTDTKFLQKLLNNFDK
jgi:5'-nucleotidase